MLALEANIQNGDIVDVFSEKGSYQGSGLYNGNSRIRIRLLSRNANDRFDEDFFYRRLQHAISYRATAVSYTHLYIRKCDWQCEAYPASYSPARAMR